VTDRHETPEQREARLLHIEQQFSNHILRAVQDMVEQSAFTRAEIAERIEWPLTKLNRMLENSDGWDMRTLGEMSYATGVEVEFEFTRPATPADRAGGTITVA